MTRSWRLFCTSLVVTLLCFCSFSAGVAVGPRVQIAMGIQRAGEDGIPVEFRSLLQVWSLVNDNFVDHNAVSSKKMAYAAIVAMLETLHDTGHTRFLSAEEYQSQKEHFQGQFSGIGATVDFRDHHPVILEPLPGSPAEKAGLRPGDAILSIDGTDTTDMSLDQATKLIRGRVGTKVVLHIKRTASNELDVTVVRGVIPIVSVRWQMIPNTDIADIAISEFSDGTDRKLSTAIEASRAQGAKKFIVDVRDDPGGLLDQSVGVSSAFLQQGKVLVQQDAKGHRDDYNTKGNAIAPNEPIVVLVNKGTASAAEIFAGAMQDNHRGRVIGVTTYGTGTVLSTYQLRDGSALLLGTLQWLTPLGKTIKDHGITPDSPVTMPEGVRPTQPGSSSFPDSATLVLSGPDTQLAAAVKELTQDVAER